MAQRLLAVLGAVAIVVVAVVVRAAIDDRGTRGATAGSDGRRVLVCAKDLADACDALDGVTVIREDAAATAAEIGSGTLPEGADAWVTTTAWTEVVAARSPGRLGRAELLAQSSAILAVDPRRAAAVTSLCGDTSPWRCLGDNAGIEWSTLGHGGMASWGVLKTGLPSADSAVGLSVLASSAVGFFDGADFALNDFDGSGFRDWLAGFTAASGTGDPAPISSLVTTRGKYTAVADVAASVGRRDVDVLGSLGVQTSVVLVALPHGDAPPSSRTLRDALVADGWDGASGSAPTSIFKPGVLAALHTLWMEVTR